MNSSIFSRGVDKKSFRPHKEFSQAEQRSGILLIAVTIISVILANSRFADAYIHFWHSTIGIHGFGSSFTLSIEQWINDGLMTIFFLVVGLEIKRELKQGELSTFKKAALPMLAALGGMIVPAFIYSLIATDASYAHGWGIPMATDIAFALGIISLLGSRVPTSIKIFLTALAVTDDLGAIIVIAVAYTTDMSLFHLLVAFGIFILMFLMNRLRVSNFVYYILAGAVMWYFMLKSGVHATLAGVFTAITIPSNTKFREYRETALIEHRLHEFSTFNIMPLFALANTALPLNLNFGELMASPLNHGIVAGLVLGKPIGIIGFSLLAIKLKLGVLSDNIRFKHILGAGFLGGIGFTMSIFISMLAFNSPELQSFAKVSVLLGSLTSGIIGYAILRTGKPIKDKSLSVKKVEVDSEYDDI